MNRIILIGNGFDLAHGLKTKYTDFMDWYWREFGEKFYERRKHSGGIFKRYIDDFVSFTIINERKREEDSSPTFAQPHEGEKLDSYENVKKLIFQLNLPSHLPTKILLSFKNEFWKHISEKSCLQNWLDIENEYYDILKSYLKDKNRNERVKKLNAEFCQVKDLLEEYLTEVCEQEIKKIESIENALESVIKIEEIATSKEDLFFDHILSEIDECDVNRKEEIDRYIQDHPERFVLSKGKERYRAIRRFILDNKLNDYIKPDHPTILNFNYTKTAQKLYMGRGKEIIDIHGELKNKNNPIIFGYGDELDDDYKEIEKTNDNDFLDNIKSIHYHKTDNYRRLLEFLQDEPYQVFIMGHSCGNSDRTLLNTIFEHENCISIKPFYHQWKDEETGEIKDNYTELVKNISRNFNDKQNLRDIVVNQKDCLPLVPCQTP